MKRLAALLLAVVMVLSLCSCSSAEKEPDPANTPAEDVSSDPVFVELNSDICKKIEAKINEDVGTGKNIFLLAVTLTYEETGLTFTDVKITKKKQEDRYTYIAYGVIYAKDNYDEKYKQNINLVYTAVKSEEEECGYEIMWDLIFVD